jgi:Protein of unknown function (DUF3489)
MTKKISRRKPAKKSVAKPRINIPAQAPPKGTKTEQIIELLRNPDGASIAEITKATGWQTHSIRGFISGTLRKKLGLTVQSSPSADGVRRYKL